MTPTRRALTRGPHAGDSVRLANVKVVELKVAILTQIVFVTVTRLKRKQSDFADQKM